MINNVIQIPSYLLYLVSEIRLEEDFNYIRESVLSLSLPVGGLAYKKAGVPQTILSALPLAWIILTNELGDSHFIVTLNHNIHMICHYI